MTWMMVVAAVLLVTNVIYCIMKITADFRNAKLGLSVLGILAAAGALAMLAWLLFLFALRSY